MSNLSQFFGGGGFANRVVITSSSNFMVPAGATKIRAHAWGGGGSGAMIANTAGGYAGGGGGGGYSAFVFSTTPGTTMSIVIGAGGASVSRTSIGSTRGNAGGNTSVTYGTKTITAYGGAGGANTANGTQNIFVAGALGGAAANGDVNIPGGNAHSLTFSGFTTRVYSLATGGAAAATPLYGTPPNASITFVDTNSLNVACSFGGHGLGSYSAFSNTNPGGAGSPKAFATGGGGTSSISTTNYGVQSIDALGPPVAALPIYSVGSYTTDFSLLIGYSPFNFYGSGAKGAKTDSGASAATALSAEAFDTASTYASAAVFYGAGGGGGGAAIYSSSAGAITATAGYTDLFGGGGGACSFHTIPSETISRGGKGGLGGGGGGGAYASAIASTSSNYSGAGGDGIVILEW